MWPRPDTDPDLILHSTGGNEPNQYSGGKNHSTIVNQSVMIIVLKDRARSLASRTLPPSLRMKEPVNTGRKTCVAVFPVLSFLCHPSDRSTRPGNPGFSNTHTADEIAARLCLTGVWTLPACWGPVWGLLKEPSSEKFLTSIFFFLESVRARGVL